MDINLNDIHVIAGMRGYGKTTLAKKILSIIAGQSNQYIILDNNDEYREFDNRIVPQPGQNRKKLAIELGKQIWNTGNLFIVVDEAEKYLPVFPVLLPPYWDNIIEQGRHRNLGGIFITRRIANLNKTVISQAAKVFLFRHFEKNDIQYLREFLDDVAYSLQRLKEFQYFMYDGKGKVKHCIL